MDSRRKKLVAQVWYVVSGIFEAIWEKVGCQLMVSSGPTKGDIEEFLNDTVSSHQWDLEGHHLYQYEWTDYERNPRSGGSAGIAMCYVSRDKINEETRLIALAELYMMRSRYMVEKAKND